MDASSVNAEKKAATCEIFGRVYSLEGRWREAEELEVQAMEARKRVLGAKHSDTLISISNLATTYWNQERWREAEELGVRALEAGKRVLGAEHPNTLTSMSNLAWRYSSQERWKEAIALMSDVVEFSHKSIGLSHPVTLKRQRWLADWLGDSRRRGGSAIAAGDSSEQKGSEYG